MRSALHSALLGVPARRRRLLAKAHGVVLELGGGANVPHYRNVDRVVVVEPDAARRRTLLDRVAAADVKVEVHETTLDDPALAPSSFDTVVSTFVLCTVPDPAATLSAIRRLLRPEGRLLFLEHVRAGGWRAAMQRVSAPVWPRFFDGCHVDRDSVKNIRAAGYLITDLERFTLRATAPVVSAAVQGVAVPRSDAERAAA
jgi:SAM-dependent methyltransferase